MATDKAGHLAGGGYRSWTAPCCQPLTAPAWG